MKSLFFRLYILVLVATPMAVAQDSIQEEAPPKQEVILSPEIQNRVNIGGAVTFGGHMVVCAGAMATLAGTVEPSASGRKAAVCGGILTGAVLMVAGTGTAQTGEDLVRKAVKDAGLIALKKDYDDLIEEAHQVALDPAIETGASFEVIVAKWNGLGEENSELQRRFVAKELVALDALIGKLALDKKLVGSADLKNLLTATLDRRWEKNIPVIQLFLAIHGVTATL